MDDKPEVKRILRLGGVLLIALGAALIALMIFWLVMGYVVRDTSDPAALADGLGRLLDPSPEAIRLLVPYWPGVIWFVVDCVFALAALVFGNMAIVKGRELWRGVRRGHKYS